MMEMTGVDMKSQPSLNRPSPLLKSSASAAAMPNLPVKESITEKKLIVACRRRKMIRKAPLTAWMNFLPIEELNINIVFGFKLVQSANIAQILQVP